MAPVGGRLAGELGLQVGLGLGGGAAEAVVGEESSQRTSQQRPMEPVVTKAARHPQRAVTPATSRGAMSAEAFEPELKRPTALPRSSVGNHSLTALMAAGKLPDSPRPRKVRAMKKPMTELTREWEMEARAQIPMARGVAGFGAKAVDDAAGEEESEAVGELEDDDDVAEVVIEDGLVARVEGEVPTHEWRVVQHGFNVSPDVAIHVVDGGREEEEGRRRTSGCWGWRSGGGAGRVGGEARI